jgi:hypothetical protein
VMCESHSFTPEWCSLARISIRYVSIETSEGDIEQLLREQKDIQGLSGVNFGSETLYARLCIRDETHPES